MVSVQFCVKPNIYEKKRIFLALDQKDYITAKSLLRTLEDELAGVKLGLEFFAHNGPDGVIKFKKDFPNLPIFLDLKLHDIPETILKTVAALLPLKPDFISLHVSGGREMLKKAAELINKINANTQLLGVTLLTSLDKTDLTEIGFLANSFEIQRPVDKVLQLAKLALSVGITGLVASPMELSILRKNFGKEILLITPGIRSLNEIAADDQKRVMLPEAAITAGADYLVIGRPITKNPEPLKALKSINQAIALSLK